MASDNKQIIRGIYDAFNRGDIDAVVNALTDDVEWNAPGGAPFSGIRRGPRAVADYLHEIPRWVRIDEFDVDDVLADGHKVIALGRYITPKDMLAGVHQEIHAERNRKL